MYKIAVVVGSLRQESLNLKFAKALDKLGGPRFEFDYAEIGELPMYNDDLWQNPPASVLKFKRTIDGADAVLLVTPEFNRSIPAVLKNALDWGSRPYGRSSWSGRVSRTSWRSMYFDTLPSESHVMSTSVELCSGASFSRWIGAMGKSCPSAQ